MPQDSPRGLRSSAEAALQDPLAAHECLVPRTLSPWSCLWWFCLFASYFPLPCSSAQDVALTAVRSSLTLSPNQNGSLKKQGRYHWGRGFSFSQISPVETQSLALPPALLGHLDTLDSRKRRLLHVSLPSSLAFLLPSSPLPPPLPSRIWSTVLSLPPCFGLLFHLTESFLP